MNWRFDVTEKESLTLFLLCGISLPHECHKVIKFFWLVALLQAIYSTVCIRGCKFRPIAEVCKLFYARDGEFFQKLGLRGRRGVVIAKFWDLKTLRVWSFQRNVLILERGVRYCFASPRLGFSGGCSTPHCTRFARLCGVVHLYGQKILVNFIL